MFTIGLDNGIIIRARESVVFSKKVKPFSQWTATCKVETDDNDCIKSIYNGQVECEIAYFRKCWNIRGMMLCCENAVDGGVWKVDHRDLKNFYRALKTLDEESWDEDESIWSWDEIKQTIKQTINNLKGILDLMEAGKYDFEILFYDSY